MTKIPILPPSSPNSTTTLAYHWPRIPLALVALPPSAIPLLGAHHPRPRFFSTLALSLIHQPCRPLQGATMAIATLDVGKAFGLLIVTRV